MAVFAPIPLPKPGEGLAEGSDWMHKLLMAPIERREKEASAKHQQALAELESNPLKLDLLRAQIGHYNALSDQARMGGGLGKSGSAGYKDIVALVNEIKRDKGVDDDEAYQLANRALAGEDVGLGGIAGNMVDQVVKRGTTAGAITKGIQANQAEAEMPIIDKAIDEGRQPYGTTIMGISPAQIKDSLNVKDKDAQKRVGNYIASDLLAFDKAALQTRIAGTESGVTIIQEIMDKAKQTINAKYPVLSNEARQTALNKVSSTLKDMLKARNKVGIRASSASRSGQSEENNQGGIVSFLTPDGKNVVEIPANKASEFEKDYPDHTRLSG